jgi:hypothetical protein
MVDTHCGVLQHTYTSSCHHAIMSSCHHVIMSSCHHVIMSSCHHVIMSCHVMPLHIVAHSLSSSPISSHHHCRPANDVCISIYMYICIYVYMYMYMCVSIVSVTLSLCHLAVGALGALGALLLPVCAQPYVMGVCFGGTSKRRSCADTAISTDTSKATQPTCNDVHTHIHRYIHV